MTKEIVYFSCVSWDFLYQRPQQILTRLAKKGFRVIYVEPQTSNVPMRTSLKQAKQILKIVPGFDMPLIIGKHRDLAKYNGITVLETVGPIEGLINTFNKICIDHTLLSSLSLSVRSAMHSLGFSHPMTWTNQPFWLPVISTLPDAYLVYDCLDEISAFTGHSDVISLENKLLNKADLVMCTSKRLFDKCAALNHNSYIVPNAVDYEHFSKALADDTAIPAEMARIPAPIIGYIGCVGDWFDMNLLMEAANSNPKFSFVIIGRVICNIPDADRIPPNIHFLGKKDYRDLPSYLKNIDVGIIPFKINSLTLSANPVKLYEYLAAGKPVVSTELPEVRRYKPIVLTATDSRQFCREIEKALEKKDISLYANIAKENTWEMRCDYIMELLTGAT